MPVTTISITGRSVLRLLALVLGHPRPAARLSGGPLGIVVSYRSRVAPEAADHLPLAGLVNDAGPSADARLLFGRGVLQAMTPARFQRTTGVLGDLSTQRP
jgi:hypothetical protein